MHEHTANVVDVDGRRVFWGRVTWEAGVISSVTELGGERPGLPAVMPGFVDAHLHIESSLLPPRELGRLAVRHGTVACVADPHEIANVLGAPGVQQMLEDARSSPLVFAFGAPSCVPATRFESAGAALGPEEVRALLAEPGVRFLSEVMNFPGVLSKDPGIMAKLAAAMARGLPIDGHAPGLRGAAARAYTEAGISTDHEATTLDEATEKLALGMKILIREGSAARSFEALHPLISTHPGQVMLCSDDKHPDDLARGHINVLVARAVAHGHSVFDAVRAASLVPQDHYGLALGRLRPGDPLTAVEVRDLSSFEAQRVWIRGQLVAQGGAALSPFVRPAIANRFDAEPIDERALELEARGELVRVMVARDGELFTDEEVRPARVEAGLVRAEPEADVLWLANLSRYERAARPAVALVRGFGLRRGALASSVAHDSHNVVAVGVDGASLARAMNAVILARGGLAVADGEAVELLPLPLAGLMSDLEGDVVAARYAALDRAAKALGSSLRAPFMTLSFMALLVIPRLKLSDRGLFDGVSFAFTDVSFSRG
jgi:adenine deaminase